MEQEGGFENTFAPACKNRRLTAREIVAGMRLGAFSYDQLPVEVRRAVDAEVGRQRAERVRPPRAEEDARMLSLLSSARDLVRQGSAEGAARGAGVIRSRSRRDSLAGRSRKIGRP